MYNTAGADSGLRSLLVLYLWSVQSTAQHSTAQRVVRTVSSGGGVASIKFASSLVLIKPWCLKGGIDSSCCSGTTLKIVMSERIVAPHGNYDGRAQITVQYTADSRIDVLVLGEAN